MVRTRKAAANGESNSSQSASHSSSKDEVVSADIDGSTTSRSNVHALLAPSSTAEREEVKVNNASVTELKHACDDALKRVRRILLLSILLIWLRDRL